MSDEENENQPKKTEEQQKKENEDLLASSLKNLNINQLPEQQGDPYGNIIFTKPEYKYYSLSENIRDYNKQFRKRKKLTRADKTISSNVSFWVSLIIENDIQGLENIKNFLNEGYSEFDSNPNVYGKIVDTIVNCRQEGERILFNNSLFKRPLHKYITGKKFNTKCLSNDYLNLLVNCDQLLIAQKLTAKEFEGCYLKSVKIVSDNTDFSATTYKGYIQDYSPKFSAICSQTLSKDSALALINKQDEIDQKKFKYDGIEFKYFGNTDLCVASLSTMDKKEMLSTFNNMKFFYSDKSGFASGEKVVSYNDLVFLDISLTPEDFCPSYWSSTDQIQVRLLYDFERDYNYLFNTLIKDTGKNKDIKLPDNLAYWDTLTQCFDFFAVLAITGVSLSTDIRKKLSEWVDRYNKLKPYIKKWKTNQMLFQRICIDYITFFLNNSDIIRFQKLNERVDKYRNILDTLLDEDAMFDAMKTFFSELPFLGLINNQLKLDLKAFSGKLYTVIKDFVTGNEMASTTTNIKAIANEIYSFQPTDNFENASLPILLASGPFANNNIKIDSISLKVDENKKAIVKKNIKKELKSKEQRESYAKQGQNLKTYLGDYWDWYVDPKKLTFDENFDWKRDIFDLFNRDYVLNKKRNGDRYLQKASEYVINYGKRLAGSKPGKKPKLTINKKYQDDDIEDFFDTQAGAWLKQKDVKGLPMDSQFDSTSKISGKKRSRESDSEDEDDEEEGGEISDSRQSSSLSIQTKGVKKTKKITPSGGKGGKGGKTTKKRK